MALTVRAEAPRRLGNFVLRVQMAPLMHAQVRTMISMGTVSLVVATRGAGLIRTAGRVARRTVRRGQHAKLVPQGWSGQRFVTKSVVGGFGVEMVNAVYLKTTRFALATVPHDNAVVLPHLI